VIAAVFDVDRTLLPRTTAERIFVRHLWREGELGWRQALSALLFTARHPRPSLLAEKRSGLVWPRVVWSACGGTAPKGR
jgi:hypothetical protein